MIPSRWMRAGSLRPRPLTFAIIPVAAILFIGFSLKYGGVSSARKTVLESGVALLSEPSSLVSSRSTNSSKTKRIKEPPIDWSKETVGSAIQKLDAASTKLQNRDLMLSVRVKKIVAQLSQKVAPIPTANHISSIYFTCVHPPAVQLLPVQWSSALNSPIAAGRRLLRSRPRRQQRPDRQYPRHHASARSAGPAGHGRHPRRGRRRRQGRRHRRPGTGG
jgi:hypothetical protein